VKEFKPALLLLRMWKNLRISPEALRDHSTRKLRAVVQHAYSATRHYRNLFDASGVRLQDIRIPSDLSRIPVSKKEDMLQDPSGNRIARDTDVKRCLRMSATGAGDVPWDVLISP